MFVVLALCVLAAAPEAGAANEAALLKTFREEFVTITPGTDKFPAQLELVDGKRTRTLKPTGPYAIAKYEVPQNLWVAVMGSNPSRWKGPRNSVEMLSFDDAQDFCKRATEKLRAAKLIEPTQAVRLPTEAEWEYAARAGTTTRYSFGDDLTQLDAYAWHTGNAAGNDPAVGEKKPNAWGLYDTHGYLWEWCEASGPNPGAAVQGSLRGGSWKDKGELLANDYRRAAERDLRDDAVGLRCVLTVPVASETPAK
ncbi:MAG: formylglycine-generating enzyme family protein [Planctomycetia bacterium]|nr:formylglycine-generating enzyme family protein [Planctomycetia bacterium]